MDAADVISDAARLGPIRSAGAKAVAGLLAVAGVYDDRSHDGAAILSDGRLFRLIHEYDDHDGEPHYTIREVRP
jgi:hypothetical protein